MRRHSIKVGEHPNPIAPNGHPDYMTIIGTPSHPIRAYFDSISSLHVLRCGDPYDVCSMDQDVGIISVFSHSINYFRDEWSIDGGSNGVEGFPEFFPEFSHGPGGFAVRIELYGHELDFRLLIPRGTYEGVSPPDSSKPLAQPMCPHCNYIRCPRR